MDSVYTQGSCDDIVGLPCGRWSLWEMFNFGMKELFAAFLLVRQHLDAALLQIQQGNGHQPLDADYKLLTRGNLNFAQKKCGDWLLPSMDDRFARLWLAFDDPRCTNGDLAIELRPLLEQMEDDLKKERFYHYPQHKARPLIFMPGEWTATLAAFPSVEKEIERGLDCYGFEDNDACIFHMMRVAEIGMRALARERQVLFPKHPLEWADWQNIIEGIERSTRALGQTMSRGPDKDAALAFYSGAVGQLHGFKDTFRNAIMHVRKSYDELDAQRAVSQVRDFMNGLSAKIGEKTKKPIRRWS